MVPEVASSVDDETHPWHPERHDRRDVGASAPAGDLFPAFGISASHVAAVARKVMTGDLRGVISAPFGHEAPAAPAPPEAHA